MADDKGSYLTFVSVQKGQSQSFNCVITNYTKGYAVQMDSNTVRTQKNFTPRRVKENELQLTVLARNIEEYDELKLRIAFSQRASLVAPQNGTIRFSYPSLKMDYLGFIVNGPEGANRFDITPSLTLTVLLFKDTINTSSTQYSSLDGASFTDIYGTSIADLYGPTATITTPADGIMANNPPVIGGGGGGRGPTAQ